MTDTRWRFRPRLGPILAVVPILAVLVGLGTWQMQRLAEKKALIADLAARADQVPTALPTTLADPAALEFAPVRLHGQFRHDRELYVGARVYQGKAGFHVVTPFVLADGRAVLVNRGWVPSAKQAPETRTAGQIAGTVTVDGILRTGGWRGNDLFRPANSPEKNLWLWMDLPAMAAHADVANTVTTYYVAAGEAAIPGGLPVGGFGRPEVRNTHFGYAMTWYGLAVVLLVIAVVHQSQRRDGKG